MPNTVLGAEDTAEKRKRDNLESQACRVTARRELKVDLICQKRNLRPRGQEKSSGHTADGQPSLQSWKVRGDGLRGHLALNAQVLEAETSSSRLRVAPS